MQTLILEKLFAIQILKFLTALPTRQDGVVNRNKAYSDIAAGEVNGSGVTARHFHKLTAGHWITRIVNIVFMERAQKIS